MAHDGFGVVLGAMALHRPAATGRLTGSVAWLHCRENQEAARTLVRAVVEDSAGLTAVTAFTDPGPLEPGLPGLPLHDRPVTTEVFAEAGFRTMDQWLLLHRPGRHAEGDNGPHLPAGGPTRWIAAGGAAHGLHRPARPTVALAKWRDRLRGSLERLDQAGGSDALTTVDLLAPDASVRCHLLEQAGFTEVDLLRSLALT
ncbi:hypothetical protein AB0O91_01005 [Kitasatospora sp. NPDC089797]|uniref:hypothetical protein n=1 Tax=Kitasatospora sp. NPDC089797 TaxID=3155298 RepID=UPI003431568B